jgi:hypothetical protein
MDHKEIIKELIKSSFPKLKKKKIKIIESKFFVTYGLYLPVINLIILHKKCRNFSHKVKIGILVHELCHAEQSSKLGFLKSIFLFINYWLSKKVRKKVEVQADKLAIKKGYAKELFEMTKVYEKEFSKVRYGLSTKQIKH